MISYSVINLILKSMGTKVMVICECGVVKTL